MAKCSKKEISEYQKKLKAAVDAYKHEQAMVKRYQEYVKLQEDHQGKGSDHDALEHAKGIVRDHEHKLLQCRKFMFTWKQKLAACGVTVNTPH